MAHFDQRTLDFLRDLAANNNRQWFKQNRDRYLSHIQEPALEFITDFARPLAGISPHFSADARVVGGSLFRIQRDTRYAADKTPYKENTGLQFRHTAGQDVHAPGFYLHIQPGECFMGAGMWRPPTPVAYRVRQTIFDHPQRWQEVTGSDRFLDLFALDGESLIRPPRGFSADHPLIDDLRRKDFLALVHLSEDEITDDLFLDDFTTLCTVAAPFMRFLCEAVGVDF